MNGEGLFYSFPTTVGGEITTQYHSSATIDKLLEQDEAWVLFDDKDKWRAISLLLQRLQQTVSPVPADKAKLFEFCLSKQGVFDWLKSQCFLTGRLTTSDSNTTSVAAQLERDGNIVVQKVGKGSARTTISWDGSSFIPDSLTGGGSLVKCQGAVSKGDHLLFEKEFSLVQSNSGGVIGIPCVSGEFNMTLRETSAQINPPYALFSPICAKYIAKEATHQRGRQGTNILPTICCELCLTAWNLELKQKRKKMLNIQMLIQSPQSAELMSSCPTTTAAADAIVTESGAEMLKSPLSVGQLTSLPTSLKDKLLANLYKQHNKIINAANLTVYARSSKRKAEIAPPNSVNSTSSTNNSNYGNTSSTTTTTSSSDI
jgi:hypothetical protein